jgi:hypothetical protein
LYQYLFAQTGRELWVNKGSDSNPMIPSSRRSFVLRGRTLILSRAIWLLVAILSLGLFLLSVPYYFRKLLRTCTDVDCSSWQLSPLELTALQNLGFPHSLYALYGTTLSILLALAFTSAAFIIFWRRSNEGIALITATWLVTFGTMSDSPQALAEHQPLAGPLVQFLGDLGWVYLLPVFLFMFPDGRFTPRWTRWLMIVFLLMGIVGNSMEFFSPQLFNEMLPQLVWFSMMLLCIVTQVYRYMRVSDLAQRQQTKWVVWGLVVAVFGLGYGARCLKAFCLSTSPDCPPCLVNYLK